MAFRLVLVSPKATRGMAQQVRDARDLALRAAGEHWAEKILPGHFTAGAEGKYGYAKRTERHLRRKRREGRGQDPNVYTGLLRNKMLGMEPKVTVNRRGVTLVWPGLPRYTYVVDTLEFITGDRRWDDEAVAKTRAWMLEEAKRAKNPAQARERVEKRIAGIFAWRKAHPKTDKGKFKRVRRPDKVKEITEMNRSDADSVAAVFKASLEANLKAKK